MDGNNVDVSLCACVKWVDLGKTNAAWLGHLAVKIGGAGALTPQTTRNTWRKEALERGEIETHGTCDAVREVGDRNLWADAR